MAKHRPALFFLSVFVSIILSQSIVFADEVERILDYQSYITVNKDRTIKVQETIKVMATGDKIQRGIYRTFPLKYKDRFGNTIRVDFKILDIRKNGSQEPYHTENVGNGIKIYLGSENVFLDSGEYTYTILYETDRQIGFFDDFDEFYWNVTGLDWEFVIDRVEATIELPPEARIINKIAYTGSRGAQGTDYEIGYDEKGNIKFTTTRPLMYNEGMTIAVSWQKGVIAEPTSQEKTGYFFSDNKNALAALLGFILLFLYYFLTWLKVGKDPEKGVIYPQFEPPKGFSPAAVRYVMKMGYSDRVFSASIVDMAVKGYLTITENMGKYILQRKNRNDSVLSAGEKSIAKSLFSRGDKIEIKQSNHQTLQNSISALKNSLKSDFEKLHFRKNSGKMVPGIIISILIFVAITITAEQPEVAVMLAVWLAGWSAGVAALLYATFKAWKFTNANPGQTIFKKSAAILTTLFALPFVGAEILVLFFFAGMTSPLSVLLAIIVIFLNILFYRLLKAPTILGRKMMDHIEGFKMYLETAEEDRLNMLSAPRKTPELYEKFLPYAMALDAEIAWTEKFTIVLMQASKSGSSYSPAWYSGRSTSAFSTSGFSANLGSSLSSAISSSSRAPGSSSGSGGGGSSGGGGGGGGGGGW